MRSFISLALLISLAVAAAPIVNEGATNVVPNSWIITYKDGVTDWKRRQHQNEVHSYAITRPGMMGVGHTFSIGSMSGYQVMIDRRDMACILDSAMARPVQACRVSLI